MDFPINVSRKLIWLQKFTEKDFGIFWLELEIPIEQSFQEE